MQNLDKIENEDLCADDMQAAPVPKKVSKKSLLAKARSGATAIEYALIASLIAVAIITAVTTMGTKAAATFDEVSSKLK